LYPSDVRSTANGPVYCADPLPDAAVPRETIPNSCSSFVQVPRIGTPVAPRLNVSGPGEAKFPDSPDSFTSAIPATMQSPTLFGDRASGTTPQEASAVEKTETGRMFSPMIVPSVKFTAVPAGMTVSEVLYTLTVICLVRLFFSIPEHNPLL